MAVLSVLVGIGVVGSIAVLTIRFGGFALLFHSGPEMAVADVDHGADPRGFPAEPVGGENFSIVGAPGSPPSDDQPDPLAPALDPSWWRLHDGTTATTRGADPA